jgi:hypothetical protein
MMHVATHVPPSTRITMTRGHRWYAATYDVINRARWSKCGGCSRQMALSAL